jgi:hypothetical protein
LPSAPEECVVTRVDGPAEIVVELASGETVIARAPHHVGIAWLRAAVAIAPVEGLVVRTDAGRPVLWGVFPDERHDAARPEVHLRAGALTIDAADSVDIVSGTSRLSLEPTGEVVLRGRDVLSRASEVNRVQGGRVRIN